jgi:hypothetical protein
LCDVLHVLFCCIHVIYVAHWHTAAVSCKVARFSTVETGAFGLRAAWFFLRLCGCRICVLGGRRICVYVVILILLVIVGCPGSRQVNGDLYAIICRSWGIGGVVRWPLLLLRLPLLLVLLGTHSPCLRFGLVPVLTKGVIEWSGVWQSLSSSDEFYHLSAFYDFNCLGFICIVCCWEWCSDDFI